MREIMLTREYIVRAIRQRINEGMSKLLEGCHIYQSIRIETNDLEVQIQTSKIPVSPFDIIGEIDPATLTKKANSYRNELKLALRSITEEYWEFEYEEVPRPIPGKQGPDRSETLFKLPTIKIDCVNCDSVKPPHNSGYKKMQSEMPIFNFGKIQRQGKVVPVQVFIFPYLCQSCKKEPLVLTVRRKGLKLQLVGRSHFETVNLPKYIPQEESKYLGEAIVAYHGGRELAAIFFLRFFIEQYLRHITGTSARATGEELTEKYAKLLSEDFPKKFTSLKTVYEELSSVIHGGALDGVYDRNWAAIDKHFQLLEHFPIPPSQ